MTFRAKLLEVSTAADRESIQAFDHIMGYRRSKNKVAAARQWSTFVARNREVIEAAGLPEVVTQSVYHWDDLLMHGHLDHHPNPAGFTVEQLSEQQYTALLQLVETYFVIGYEYFTPLALRVEDRERLETRYRTG